MKANRVAVGKRDDNAEIGIGTLIVFIAAVLVAAVAAAVLINTSGELQERGEQTGKAATRDVSSSLKLMGVWASRSSTAGDMTSLNLTIGTSSASEPIDLSNTTIVLSSGAVMKTLSWVSGNATAGSYNATEVRDADGSYSATVPVMNAGDLVTVWLDLGSGVNNMPLSPGKPLNIKFLPPVGPPLLADVTMPPTYGVDTVIQVR